MRRIFINCLLLASLAVALPNARNKRHFEYLRNLAQNLLNGNNEINVELTPDDEAKDTRKFRLYEVPGYDILIKVPVDNNGEYNGEVPVNLNAFGATVGTNTPANTFNALSNVNNLVSSGILDDSHDQRLKGSFGPIFPNNYEENESYEEELARNGELLNTEESGSYEEDDFKRPTEVIEQYSQEQSEESPMEITAQNQRAAVVPQTIEPNSDLPNCDQVRVDTGYLLPPETYPMQPIPEPYPAPAPAFVNVFYPNPADQSNKNPRPSETNHHHHHNHHVHHHRRPHHHRHHPSPHHHEHKKINEPTNGNGTANDEMEGSTTEDPINYKVQFVSRVTNTETFQGINTGQTLNNTAVNDNASNPIGANYGSNQFVYRNQDNLKMVTFEDKLKTNNATNNKNNESPIADYKDQESGGAKVNTPSNVTENQNIENSTSAEKTENEKGGHLTPERSENNHVHHRPRHPSNRGHHHHQHRHLHHQHHPHHHISNHHPLHFQTPPNFDSNQNPNEWNGNGNEPNGKAPENKMPEEVPLQRFEDSENDNTTDDDAAPKTDNPNQEEFATASDKPDGNKTLNNRKPMSTDEDPRDQDGTFAERLRDYHLHHRFRHPARRQTHHHHHHHSHTIKPANNYGQIPNFFDMYPQLKSMMNENTLHTNKVTENPAAPEESTELYNKLKDDGSQHNVEESIRKNASVIGDSRSSRGDVPDE